MNLVAHIVVAALALAPLARAGEAKKGARDMRESAYYEFRARVSDRNTLERTFTLAYAKGSLLIGVTPETKIFRRGRKASLGDVKSGDSVHGYGQVRKGRLVAIAAAFGDEGVDLPPEVKVPESITLPPIQSSD